MTADADFWKSLNHWRGHVGLAPLPAVPLDLSGLRELVRAQFIAHKAPGDDIDLTKNGGYLQSPCPSPTGRMAFVLKCLARVRTRPATYDPKTGEEIRPAFNGWTAVEELLAAQPVLEEAR